tara:strand:+ start:1267 stop:1602 length:336 start_codon:yes stop_codon:yes gene_type:complete
MKPTLTLKRLLRDVEKQSAITLPSTSYGYGNRENVPYQMITHLFNGPKERNQLMLLSYAGSSQGERDPYHNDFAKQYDLYRSNLTKVLNALGWDIKEYVAPNGSIWYRLEK